MTLAQRCGVHGPAREIACAAVLRRVHDTGVHAVRVSWADLHGSFRAKTVVGGEEALHDALHDGVGMVSTLMLKDSADRSALPVFEAGALDALPGFGAANNLFLLPDPDSFTLLPWAPQTAWLRGEAFWADGSVVETDPRRVLQRALALLAQRGLALRCGLEIEFHIYRIESDGLATDAEAAGAWPGEPPLLRHTHPGWQLLSEAYADLADEPLAIVHRTALALGLPLRSLEIEMGPSQFEAVLAPTDALTAADQMLVFRNGVRQALRRAGFHVSFVCKPPLAGSVASGWHLHHSLVDAGGANVFMREATSAGVASGDAREVLTDTGALWLAGLLRHAAGMAALCAPSIPAYARYQGGVMAPRAVVWGRDNRGALLRVLGGPGDLATRIENRLGEPMANPYLAIAAQVFAGLDGLDRAQWPPSAAATPYDAALPPLPVSLGHALQALVDDGVLMQGLGQAMSQVVLAVLRQALTRHAQAEDKAQWERREYFSRY